jgi:hypothetical protein
MCAGEKGAIHLQTPSSSDPNIDPTHYLVTHNRFSYVQSKSFVLRLSSIRLIVVSIVKTIRLVHIAVLDLLLNARNASLPSELFRLVFE